MPYFLKDGVPIYWEESGRGVPLILLHPFPLNGAFWDCQRESLAGTARVLAPDFRGFGRSGQDGRISSMALLADDLAALLEHLGLEQIVLGGLSMGGYVALEFLRMHKKRIRALILADTRPQADTAEARLAREELARLAMEQGSAAVAERMLPRLLGETSIQTRPDLVQYVRQMITGNSPAAIAAASRGMARRRDRTRLLQRISRPTLVITGSEDILTTPQGAEIWAREIPGAVITAIEAAGHLSSLEQPEAFNEAVRAFLSQRLV